MNKTAYPKIAACMAVGSARTQQPHVILMDYVKPGRFMVDGSDVGFLFIEFLQDAAKLLGLRNLFPSSAEPKWDFSQNAVPVATLDYFLPIWELVKNSYIARFDAIAEVGEQMRAIFKEREECFK